MRAIADGSTVVLDEIELKDCASKRRLFASVELALLLPLTERTVPTVEAFAAPASAVCAATEETAGWLARDNGFNSSLVAVIAVSEGSDATVVWLPTEV
jgi:hypothetical protein